MNVRYEPLHPFNTGSNLLFNETILYLYRSNSRIIALEVIQIKFNVTVDFRYRHAGMTIERETGSIQQFAKTTNCGNYEYGL